MGLHFRPLPSDQRAHSKVAQSHLKNIERLGESLILGDMDPNEQLSVLKRIKEEVRDARFEIGLRKLDEDGYDWLTDTNSTIAQYCYAYGKNAEVKELGQSFHKRMQLMVEHMDNSTRPEPKE